jgi:hypothetical protein
VQVLLVTRLPKKLILISPKTHIAKRNLASATDFMKAMLAII